ncbi:hypothetical protein [Nonomuraea dietziae]|uniref:hypothetical protein n=1 Tax=Nonomuraea dietziae TaxID=65515 RepID=UPI00341B9127
MLEEIRKLRRAKALGLAADLFGGCSDRLVASWRARAMASHPSDFAANPLAIRLTLMAALDWSRTTEITDALVDLFIGLVSKINTRAERKVERAIEAEAKKVHRKTEKLFSIAEASLRRPEGTVRQVVFPAVPGGEATLQALVAEAKADAKTFKAHVRTVLTNSYTSYYRRMLPKLLAAIEFKCNNTAYRPVTEVLTCCSATPTSRTRPATTTPRKTSRSRAWCRTAGWKRSSTRTGSSSGPPTSCARSCR